MSCVLHCGGNGLLYPEDGGRTFLRSINTYLPDFTPSDNSDLHIYRRDNLKSRTVPLIPYGWASKSVSTKYVKKKIAART
jgi:hypothetical protein